MSVLIKGLEMPEICAECPCMRHDSIDFVHAYQCNVTLEKITDPDHVLSRKEAKCPLIEVPNRKEAQE